jgi:hypothetical protein
MTIKRIIETVSKQFFSETMTTYVDGSEIAGCGIKCREEYEKVDVMPGKFEIGSGNPFYEMSANFLCRVGIGLWLYIFGILIAIITIGFRQ